MKNTYFIEFDGLVFTHLKNLGIPAYAFYGALLRYEYEHTLRQDGTNSMKELFADGVQIAQWRGGQALPERIYDLIHVNPVNAMDRYEENLEQLFSEQGLTEEALDDLGNALRDYMRKMERYCVMPKPIKQTTAHLCACAFVNTLFCDGVDICCIKWLSWDMKKKIKDLQGKCRKDNVAFTNARILCSLCGENSLLLQVLNTVGIGTKWSEKLHAYIAKPDHQGYSDPAERNEWLLLATVIAGRNDRTKANETDLVCAIARATKSSTLKALIADLRACGLDQTKWDELVLQTDEERSKSSFVKTLPGR